MSDSPPTVSSTEPRPFGSLLRRYRRGAGLTQEQLAERAGVSARAISDLERGQKTTPQAATLRLLAEALELSPQDHSALLAAVPRRRHQTQTAASALVNGGQIPAEVTPLIGREKDEAAAGHLLRSRGIRLLTLLGPGGVGKTRLAMRVAQNAAANYDGGACFVPLAQVTGSDLVANAICRSLGLSDAGSPAIETLVARLQDQSLLLVLDNFEHLAPAAPLVAELINACPGLTVLATSRTPLRLRAEQLLDVPPLRLPPLGEYPTAAVAGQYAGIALFIQRTRAARPEFELSDDLVPTVVSICRRLDSLPLAIELAAAQTRHIPLETLLGRLERGVNALSDGPVDAPPRQRTMRDTISWSYELLQPPEQDVFRALSVFVGGFYLDAAVYVAACQHDVLASLERLVDNSLLSMRPGGNGQPRYWMLETVRDFSRELAGLSREVEALHGRHAALFGRVAHDADETLRQHGLARLSSHLLPDHENFLAAVQWLSDQNRLEPVLRLASELVEYWIPWGYVREGRVTIDNLLLRAAEDSTVEVPPLALCGAGRLAWIQNDYDRATVLYEAAVSAYRRVNDPRGEAATLNNLGAVAHMRNQYDRAVDFYRRTIDLGRAAGNSNRAVAMSMANLGLIALHRGEDASAEKLMAEAVVLWREAGDEQLLAVTLGNLGSLECRRGRFDKAVAIQEEALAMKRKAGDTLAVAKSLGDIALAEIGRGNDARAQLMLAEALPVFHESGQKDACAEALEAMAGLAQRSGKFDHAARLYGGAAGLRSEVGAAHRTVDQPGYQAAVNELAAAMGPTALDAAWRDGEGMSTAELIQVALENWGSPVQA
jgi:predicted ATPase/DNA-binding XRE family transcriptional regulator